MVFWKYILFPFSLLYASVMEIRNWLYDFQIFKSYKITGKSIVIGNLSMGGTGKSPHTLYLWEMLRADAELAFLSRGYGRKTKGLLEVTEHHSAEEVGDEPLMFKKRVHNESLVVVSEDRKQGVDCIRTKSKEAIILLDDAYQHRKVQAGYTVLLTEFSKPYFSDYVVPMGTLREWRKGKRRADCVIVTKCPTNLSEETKKQYIQKLAVANKSVYFSTMKYGTLTAFSATQNAKFDKVLLVTGIANPKPLEEYLLTQYQVETICFQDHYLFTEKDIQDIHQKFDTFAKDKKGIIVTTEKDYIRLSQHSLYERLKNYPWYYQPITIELDKEVQFKNEIKKYVRAI